MGVITVFSAKGRWPSPASTTWEQSKGKGGIQHEYRHFWGQGNTTLRAEGAGKAPVAMHLVHSNAPPALACMGWG